ncbi:hypothetical protein ACFSKI_08145 [Pseudogracilibacillus auburnensis]|uniref:Uncharacterized protein n=1 Tax=Pseudogracilibacillus auburnensis TaxID=1494959 RepID=A0A2V3VUT1_9BACI|nr:hypothetical protein [Pseudogracilibacillus auburnensis]PXW84824.1 hypothetical protein DFR56_11368 [Pseudogracilibacillus auburnensis]
MYHFNHARFFYLKASLKVHDYFYRMNNQQPLRKFSATVGGFSVHDAKFGAIVGNSARPSKDSAHTAKDSARTT